MRCALTLLLAAGAAAPAGTTAPARPAPKGVVHKLPASERSYELLVPPLGAEAMRDLPLVVYLHGSKAPRLDRAKRDYWPLLRERRCLMALPRSRGEKMWLAGEEKYVMDVVADVQTRYSVDGERVLLLGVSGGGQAALFLADHLPKRFRAIIAVSTSPVTIRGHRHEWFYPARETLKSCPYFVVNHIAQGSSLMYWRQVRAKLAPAGASISIVPVTGEPGAYQPPPKALGAWLDAVLAGRHPAGLPDPQKRAVAKMFAPVTAALSKALAAARVAPGEKVARTGRVWRLSLDAPAGFRRAGREARTDSTGAPLAQVRLEHERWPIVVRADARSTARPMDEVLAAEEAATAGRGMLYQTYGSGTLAVGGRTWKYKVGSITYPDRRRGWVSALFVHAAAAVADDARKWLTVTVTDETQEPKAPELAVALKTALASVAAAPSPPSTAPARSR